MAIEADLERQMDVQLEQHVIGIIRQTLPKKMQHKINFEEDISLNDLGITSMSKIVLVYKIEQELGVDLSESTERIGEIVTLRDVLAFIKEILRDA